MNEFPRLLTTPSAATLALGTLALGTLTSPLLATSQDPNRGMASAWPAAILNVNGMGEQSPVLLKVPGDQSAQNPAQTTTASIEPSMSPAGSLDVPFYQLNVPGSPLAGIEFDAISSGNAIIANPVNGQPQLNQSWLNLTVSIVDETDAGLLSGPFRAAHDANRSTGSDLVSYGFRDSVGPNSSIVGKPILEATRMDLGFPTGSSGNLNGLDYGIGIRAFNEAPESSQFFPRTKVFFFSVTPSFASGYTGPGFNPHPSQLGTEGPNSYAPNPTDIYRSKFENGSWGEPELFIPGEHLGFEYDEGEDSLANLDAFDLDVGGFDDSGNPAIIVIYSGAKDGGYEGLIQENWSQLMIVSVPADPLGDGNSTLTPPSVPGLPLMDETSSGEPTRVTTGVGTGVGDFPNESEIDGLCGFDPETGIVDTMVGFPVHNSLTLGGSMGISIVNSLGLDPNDPGARHIIQATGWGDSTPVDCFAYLLRMPVEYDSADGEWNSVGRWRLVQREPRKDGYRQVTFERSAHQSGGVFVYKVQLWDLLGAAPFEQSLLGIIRH